MEEPISEILSAKEASDGMRQVIINSHRHYNCGEILFTKGEYGIATSHMVLAAEEAIKSKILLLVSIGVEISPKILNTFLHQYSLRLISGLVSTFIGFQFSIIYNGFSKLVSKYPNKAGEEFIKEKNQIYEQLIIELNNIADAKPGENKLLDNILWWENANQFKQCGFYVDYKNHHWIGPEDITEKEYLLARDIAGQEIQSIEGMIIVINEYPQEREKLIEMISKYRELNEN